MPRPFHPPLPDHSNYTWLREPLIAEKKTAAARKQLDAAGVSRCFVSERNVPAWLDIPWCTGA
jgi:hypothetical protein